jgi:hypothetical protein
VITNYVVVVLAGIYGIGRTSDLVPGERVALVIAAILILTVGITLLVPVQFDIRDVRLKIDKDDPAPFRRGLSFISSFIFIMVLSTVLAVWSSVRSVFV